MLEDRYEIEALLIRLMMQRCLLTVVGPGDGYRTSLLKVDSKRDRLLFDELMPTEGSQALRQRRKIHLYGQLDGVELDFVTRVDPDTLGDDMTCFSSRLPQAIRYRQRRDHYRIRIYPRTGLRATLRPDEPDAHECEVVDLSLGGVGLMLTGTLDFSPRERYECLLHLPEQALLTRVEPCFIRPLPYSERTRMGARFVQLAPAERKPLERFIASFQRELLRELRGGLAR